MALATLEYYLGVLEQVIVVPFPVQFHVDVPGKPLGDRTNACVLATHWET